MHTHILLVILLYRLIFMKNIAIAKKHGIYGHADECNSYKCSIFTIYTLNIEYWVLNRNNRTRGCFRLSQNGVCLNWWIICAHIRYEKRSPQVSYKTKNVQLKQLKTTQNPERKHRDVRNYYLIVYVKVYIMVSLYLFKKKIIKY